MIRSLYNWTMQLAEHPRAIYILALVSFIEASVFPVPPDVMIIPMILATPHRAWFIATVALFFSVLGGLFGYAIGMFAYEQLAQPILYSLGKADAMTEFSVRFNNTGFWTVLGAGITPFPFKVITIMSGATAMPMSIFLPTAILARAFRFYLVALLLRLYGAPIKAFIENYLGWVSAAGLSLIVLGFLGIKYL